MLKEILKKGEKSIADVRSPEYNSNLFINTAKSIRKERLNAKLENASICFEPDEDNESSAINTKKNSNMDEDEKLVRQNLRASAVSSNKQARNKSTQPQKLRKIADGLISFERYADRKKRLQSIS